MRAHILVFAASAACNPGIGTKVSDKAKPLGDVAKQATIKPHALLFSRGGNDDLATIAPGTVLISDWQDGYLRTVMAVDDSDGKLTLTTEQASLTDIIEEGETSTVVDFATLAPMARRWPGVRVKDSPLGTTFDIPLKDKLIYSDEALGLSVRIADGTIQLSPQLDLGLTIKDGTKFHAIANGQVTANLQLVVNCKQALSKHFVVTMWESPEFSIQLPPIGPVPISAQGKLIVQAGFDVDARGQVTVTMGASADTQLSYGIRYEDGQWKQEGDATASWDHTDPTLSTDVEAHAKVFVSAGVEVGLYGGLHLLKLGAGGAVGVSVDPYVQFDYPSNPSPWALRAGFSGRYWAGLTVLDKQIAGIEKPGDLLFDTGEQIAPAVDMPVPMQTGDCSDRIQDGSETDVDCGGSCGTCPIGRYCIADADCTDGTCTYGVCVRAVPATCYDGVYDGDETGNIDCGGSCLACTADVCTQNADCASGWCDTTTSPGSCLPPMSCYDGIIDNNETDVDCGGPCAPTFQCNTGQHCAFLIDCVGFACPGETDGFQPTGICDVVPLNCFDCAQDGDEQGLDCGGSCDIEPLLQCAGNPPKSAVYTAICE